MRPDLLSAFRRLHNLLKLVVARATVFSADDAADLQTVQAQPGAKELRDALEHFQAYGFKAVPLSGAEAVVLFPGGQRAHGLVVSIAHREHRPKNWQPGEVGLYTDEGTVLRAKRGQILELTQTELVINVDTLTINAGGSTIEVDASGVRITAPAFEVNSPSVDFNP